MYRKVHGSFWNDPKVRGLDSHTKLLFLYLITNPHTHISGLYYLPTSTISHETGLTLKDAHKSLKKLIDNRLIMVDLALELVWICKFFRYQGGGPSVSRSISQHLKSLHSSPLIVAFCKEYPQFNSVGNTVSHTLSDTVSIQYPIPSSVQDKDNVQVPPPTFPPQEICPELSAPDGAACAVEEEIGIKKKKNKPLKNTILLQEALSAVQLEPFRNQYSPQGLDVDACWEDFSGYVLTGSASKPFPNPSNWVDFNRAFHDSCKRAIKKGMFPLSNSPPFSPSSLRDPEFDVDAMKKGVFIRS